MLSLHRGRSLAVWGHGILSACGVFLVVAVLFGLPVLANAQTSPRSLFSPPAYPDEASSVEAWESDLWDPDWVDHDGVSDRRETGNATHGTQGLLQSIDSSWQTDPAAQTNPATIPLRETIRRLRRAGIQPVAPEALFSVNTPGGVKYRGEWALAASIARAIDANPEAFIASPHDPEFAQTVRYCVPPADVVPIAQRLLGATLVRYEPAHDHRVMVGRLVPGLSVGWEVRDGGLTYSFILTDPAHGATINAPSWYLSDRRLVAADVRYTLERLMRYPTQLGMALRSLIEHIDTPDERQVIIRLRRADSRFLHLLASPGASIRSIEWDRVVGISPFHSLSETLLVGVSPFLLARPPYSNAVVISTGGVRRPTMISVIGVQGNERRRAFFAAGDCHLVSRLAGIETLEGIAPLRPLGRGIVFLAANAQRAPWNNPEFLRAIDGLLNRRALTHHLQNTQAEPVDSLFVRSGSEPHIAINRRQLEDVLRRHIRRPIRARLLIPDNASPEFPDPTVIARFLHAQLQPYGVIIEAYVANAQATEALIASGRFDLFVGSLHQRWFDHPRGELLTLIDAIGCTLGPTLPSQSPLLVQTITTEGVDRMLSSPRSSMSIDQFPLPPSDARWNQYRWPMEPPVLVSASQTDRGDPSWASIDYCSEPLRSQTQNGSYLLSEGRQDKILRLLRMRPAVIPLFRFSGGDYYRVDAVEWGEWDPQHLLIPMNALQSVRLRAPPLRPNGQ